MPLRLPKAFFIDLDGTLIDSVEGLFHVYLAFLKKFAIQGSQEEFKSLIGPNIKEIVSALQKKHALPVNNDLVKLYLQLVSAYYSHDCALQKDAKETLEFFYKKNVSLGLVTSATKELADLILNKFQLKAWFTFAITCEKIKEGKPSPEIYNLAISQVLLKPEEIIAIEDSENGKKSACGAGLYTLILKPNQTDGLQEGINFKEVASWKEIKDLF